ncbi:hypothetical protein B0I73DRAFT_150519 [Yarrowia lipolytica]|nr:hypothetical protein YALI1_F11141g [Yarrowia lipolytica]KAB8284110.1 hypothetical protein BKA91DRAFT_157342 [Yarrowia lipolytica]KAE8173697.1 hypothetical protein BKA90DRAFT_167296 [Yarrowia lipolytica]RDW42699.1 hypothetical protein B0I73DRAFT_150519 [Yarrowia lipolytica]
MTAVMDDPAMIVAEQTKLANEYKTLARAFASNRQTRLQAQMKLLKRGRRNPLFTRISKQQDERYHNQCELISKRAEYAVACIKRVSQGERRSVWLQFHKDKNAAKMRMISKLNQQLAQIRREYCQYNLEQVKVGAEVTDASLVDVAITETKLPAVLFGKPAPATQQEAYNDLATIHAQHAHIEHQAQLERTEASFDQQDFDLVHSLENLKYSIEDERERAEEASKEHQREEARRAEQEKREQELQREQEIQQQKLHQQQLRREEEARVAQQAAMQQQAAQERAYEEDRREQQQREMERQREMDYRRQHERSLSGQGMPQQQQQAQQVQAQQVQAQQAHQQQQQQQQQHQAQHQQQQQQQQQQPPMPQPMAATQGAWTNGGAPGAGGRRTPQSLHNQLPPQMRHPSHSHSHSHSQIPPPPPQTAPGTPGSQKMYLPPPSSFQQAPPPPPPQGNFYPQYDKPMLPHPGQPQQQQPPQQGPPPPHMGQQQHPGHPQHHPGHPQHPAGGSPPGPGQPPGAYSQQMPPQYYPPPPPPHMGYPPQGYYPPREHQGPPPPLPPHMRPGLPQHQHQVYYNGSPQLYQVPPLQPPQYGRQLPPPPQWY